MSVHEGHRQRMKARFQRNGLRDFNDHEVLELLLFYCIPRRDTNEIAHNLIARFGTLAKVLDAPVQQLQEVEGMGENAAVFLSLFRETNRYYHINRFSLNQPLRNCDEYGAYLHAFFATERNEAVYLLCLDAKCMVLGCEKIAEGNVNSTAVPIRKVVEVALAKNATSVILAHNHPSGVATPSEEDRQTTYSLARTLHSVGVALVDHIIVADDEFISMAVSRMYSYDAVIDE